MLLKKKKSFSFLEATITRTITRPRMLVFIIRACTSGVIVEVIFAFLPFVSMDIVVYENFVSTHGNHWVPIALLGHFEHKLQASACTVIVSWTAAPSMRTSPAPVSSHPLFCWLKVLRVVSKDVVPHPGLFRRIKMLLHAISIYFDCQQRTTLVTIIQTPAPDFGKSACAYRCFNVE